MKISTFKTILVTKSRSVMTQYLQFFLLDLGCKKNSRLASGIHRVVEASISIMAAFRKTASASDTNLEFQAASVCR